MKPMRGLIVIAATVALAGCSSGSGNPATTAAPSASAGTTAAAPGTAMTVTESEFTIALPSKTLSAGTYTFTVTNKGKFAHNLTVDGAGVQDKATPPSDPEAPATSRLPCRKAPMSSTAPSTITKTWEWTSPSR
jgi:hypothetical protein